MLASSISCSCNQYAKHVQRLGFWGRRAHVCTNKNTQCGGSGFLHLLQCVVTFTFTYYLLCCVFFNQLLFFNRFNKRITRHYHLLHKTCISFHPGYNIWHWNNVCHYANCDSDRKIERIDVQKFSSTNCKYHILVAKSRVAQLKRLSIWPCTIVLPSNERPWNVSAWRSLCTRSSAL